MKNLLVKKVLSEDKEQKTWVVKDTSSTVPTFSYSNNVLELGGKNNVSGNVVSKNTEFQLSDNTVFNMIHDGQGNYYPTSYFQEKVGKGDSKESSVKEKVETEVKEKVKQMGSLGSKSVQGTTMGAGAGLIVGLILKRVLPCCGNIFLFTSVILGATIGYKLGTKSETPNTSDTVEKKEAEKEPVKK